MTKMLTSAFKWARISPLTKRRPTPINLGLTLLEDRMLRLDLRHSSKVSRDNFMAYLMSVSLRVAYNSSKLEDLFPVKETPNFN